MVMKLLGVQTSKAHLRSFEVKCLFRILKLVNIRGFLVERVFGANESKHFFRQGCGTALGVQPLLLCYGNQVLRVSPGGGGIFLNWSIKQENLCEPSARKISKISQIVRLMLSVSINLNSNLIKCDLTSDFCLSKNNVRHLMALMSTKSNAKLAKKLI